MVSAGSVGVLSHHSITAAANEGQKSKKVPPPPVVIQKNKAAGPPPPLAVKKPPPALIQIGQKVKEDITKKKARKMTSDLEDQVEEDPDESKSTTRNANNT